MLNKVILMGRATADPEHKVTPGGTSVTSFSIAVERNFADKTTGQRGVDFINIVAWRGTADLICKYFSKGKMIAIEGSIQTRKYEDKQGNKRVAFEVIAEQVYFCGDTKGNGTPALTDADVPPQFQAGDFEEIDTDDNDLPF